MLTVAASNKGSLAKMEDSSFAVMAYEDGMIATNECSSVTHGPLTLEICGEKGMCLFTCDRLVKRIGDGEEEVVEETKSMFHPLKQFILEDIAFLDKSYKTIKILSNKNGALFSRLRFIAGSGQCPFR